MKNEKVNTIKTVDEVLKQPYITATDLIILMPRMNIKTARDYINQLREEMQKQKLWIPKTKPYQALTKIARKKFGF